MSTTAQTPPDATSAADNSITDRTPSRTASTRLAMRTPGRLRRSLARRWPTALGAAATTASLAVLVPLPHHVQTVISAWGVLTAAVIYLTWGTARGDLADRRWLTAQTAAVLGFGAVAIVAVAVVPGTARYVLAGGWLAHAVWDVAHHRADRVVPRWYAELCMVCDVIVAASLLFLHVA